MRLHKNGVPITCVEDWKRLAPPKAEYHWVEGRSAFELAHAWCGSGLVVIPSGLQKILDSRIETRDLTIDEVLPEHRIAFDARGGDRTPSSLWRPSSRAFPEHRTSPSYPAHLEVRRISTAGTFSLHTKQPFLSQVLQGKDIGLEEVDDGIWNIVYYSTLLGKIDERTLLITGTQ